MTEERKVEVTVEDKPADEPEVTTTETTETVTTEPADNAEKGEDE